MTTSAAPGPTYAATTSHMALIGSCRWNAMVKERQRACRSHCQPDQDLADFSSAFSAAILPKLRAIRNVDPFI